MDKQDRKRIARVAEEAAKIKTKYPHLTYKEAVEKARKIYDGEEEAI